MYELYEQSAEGKVSLCFTAIYPGFSGVAFNSGQWCWLVAGGDLDVPDALLALHIAAPVQLTPTPLHPLLSPRRLAPVAAQFPLEGKYFLSRTRKYFDKNSPHSLPEIPSTGQS